MLAEEKTLALPSNAAGPTTRFGWCWIVIAAFATASIYCGVKSDGFIAADACTHYLAARFAVSDPINFVDVWNRPLVTLLYAAPAELWGRTAVRIVCAAVAVGCGIVAFFIAAKQGVRRPGLALLFTLGQPLLFLHSFGEMTELPFALLLGCAFLAWQRRRFLLAAMLVGWTPLARPEGFGFILIAAGGLLLYRKWRGLVLLPIPILMWNFAGWQISHHAHPLHRWLRDSWPYAEQSLYGRGYLLTFVALLPAVVSPFVLPATLLGIWRSLDWRSTPGRRWKPATESPMALALGLDAHLRVCVALTAALPLFVMGVHSLLYWLGKMASFGEARYLLVTAPLWGVLGARGWEWAFDRLRWRRPVAWGAAAVVAPAVANLFIGVVPVRLSHDWVSAREIADSLRARVGSGHGAGLLASHPGIFYFLDINPHATAALSKASLASPPPGMLIVWDPIFSQTNASADCTMTLDELRQAGWQEAPAPQLYEAKIDGLHTGTRDPNDPRSYWHLFAHPAPATVR